MKRRRSELRRRIYFYDLFYDLRLFLQYYRIKPELMVRYCMIFGTSFNLHHLVMTDNGNLYGIYRVMNNVM